MPPKGHRDPTLEMKTPLMVIVDSMDGETFFALLMEALKKNPPLIHDPSVGGRMTGSRNGFQHQGVQLR